MGNKRAEVIQFAASKIGVKEIKGNNDGAEVEVFTGGFNHPWCAEFVSWAFAQAGIPLPGYQQPVKNKVWNPLAAVSVMRNKLREKAGFYKEKEGYIPQSGDIIFFKGRGGSDGGPGNHVGLVESFDPATNKIHTIEGNTSDQVARRKYDLNHATIWGYGTPYA